MSHILQPNSVAFALIFAPQNLKVSLDFHTGVNNVIMLHRARRDVTFSRQTK